jgi:tetratricopeptide (TPR) repeat protein
VSSPRIEPGVRPTLTEVPRYLKGELDRAIADCSEAIRLDPTSADAYFNRAGAYSRQGDPGRAIADFTEVIRLRPSDADAYVNRVAAYRRAVADFTKALRLAPRFTEVYSNAIADYTEAIRLAPATPLPTSIGRPYIELWAMRTRPPRTNRSLKN